MTVSLDVTTVDIARLREQFRTAPQRAKAELDVARKLGAETVQRVERQLAPVDQGTLRGSVDIRYTTDGAVIWPRVNYAQGVNDGTGLYGPHASRIYPVRAKVLAWKRGGKWFFAKSTKGQKGQKFAERATAQARPQVIGYYQKAVDNLIGGH